MVYMFLTDGFEDIEAIEVLDILRRAGVDAVTVGVFSEMVKSSHGVSILTDMRLSDVKVDNAKMLILPGGPGHTKYEDSAELLSMIKSAYEDGKYIAAICAAPAVIGRMGLLENKKFTCYPGFEKYCSNGIYEDKKAVADGKIITGKGPGAAADFGFMLTTALKGKEVAEKLAKEMQYI